jgi:hypothetical protein
LANRVERLKTVVVEARHLPAASEQTAISLLAKAGLDSESEFMEVVPFSNRCTTGRKVLTSELVFLARPTVALKKLLKGPARYQALMEMPRWKCRFERSKMGDHSRRGKSGD